MTPRSEWDALQGDADSEPVEFSVAELRRSDLASLPEGLHLWVVDDNYPEATIWREGENLVCEVAEHIYSKYWWHKFSARAFADAMERAVARLKHEGHPLSDPSLESDDDVHLWVRWKLTVPTSTTAHVVADSIRAAFDTVWQRAGSILENSDSVLILGRDDGPALERLKQIEERLQELGYYTYIIKEQPDRLGESVIQKVLRYALSSKFVLIDNTEPSGHLYEIPHVTKLAECVTAVLQEDGKGPTWMFEDAYAKHTHWKKITYADGRLSEAVENAASWAERFIKQFAQFQQDHLPWFRRQ